LHTTFHKEPFFHAFGFEVKYWNVMKNVAFLEGFYSNFGEILATTLNCKRTAAAADDICFA